MLKSTKQDSSVANAISSCNISPAQIALALVVIKSKPLNISTPEYIDRIRLNIYDDGRHDEDIPKQYVDAAKFWKDAYERCEAEKVQLLNQASVQDQEQVLDNFQQTIVEHVHNSRKRKSESISKANTQSKRIRLSASSNQEAKTDDNGMKNRAVPSTLLIHLSNIMRALGGGEEDQEALFDVIRTYLQAVRIHAESFEPSEMVTEKYLSNAAFGMTSFCIFISKSYPLILQSMEKHINSGHEVEKSLINSEIVYISKVLLDHLRGLSTESERRKTRVHTRKTQVSASKNETLYQSICSTLEILICSLDVSTEWHCNLLEGLVSVYLDHLGSIISLFAFADPKSSLEDQRGLLPPTGVLISEDNVGLAITAAQIEAPYLVLTLRKIMRFLRLNISRSSFRPALLNLGSGVDENSDGLEQKIKTALQNTLLRGIFDDNDTMFRQSFQRVPDPPDPALQDMIDKQKEECNTGRWLISEVWDLLGWDILLGCD